MRELIFIFIALLALSACDIPSVSRETLNNDVESIRGQLSEQSRELRWYTDSLRVLASKVDDKALGDSISSIADDIENIYDAYSAGGLLDDLRLDIAQ